MKYMQSLIFGTAEDNLKKTNSRALIKAAKSGDIDEVLRTLEKGADINFIDKKGGSPLVHAVRTGDNKLVELLLDRGADINFIDKKGGSPLVNAVRTGDNKLVELLLDRGAATDNYYKDKVGSALIVAAQLGHTQIANTLIEAGANISSRPEKGPDIGKVAIEIFAQKDTIDENTTRKIFFSFYDMGGYIDRSFFKTHRIPFESGSIMEKIADENNTSEKSMERKNNFPTNRATRALIRAASAGNTQAVNTLIKAGADVNYTNPWGGNALISAIENGKFKVAATLILAGFAEEYSKPEKIAERDESLLKNTTLQDAFKKTILAGNPITFCDNVVDEVVLKALRSITQKDLDEASKGNLDKLKESGVYPLLKIEKHLNDKEFSLAAKNLKDFKTISVNAEAFRKPGLNDDLTSMILTKTIDYNSNSWGENLTLKIINLIKALNEPTTHFGPYNTRPPFLEPDATLAPPLSLHQRPAQASTTPSSTPNFRSSTNPEVTAQPVFASPVPHETPSGSPAGRSGVIVGVAVANTAGISGSSVNRT